MIKLVIGPKYEVVDANTEFACEYVISIQDFNDAPVEHPWGIDPEKHIVVQFDDLVSEQPIRYSSRDGSILRTHPPDMEDCKTILEFFKTIPDGSRVYVHCFAGVSRSTAMSLMMMAYHLGEGKEKEAMLAVEKMALAGRTGIWPNSWIVQMADELLGRNGALIDACNKWKAEQQGITDEINKWVQGLHEREKREEERMLNPDPEGTNRPSAHTPPDLQKDPE